MTDALLPCVLVGLAVFVAAWTLMSVAARKTYPRDVQNRLRYEDELRLRLVEKDAVYAKSGLLVEEIAGVVRGQLGSDFLDKLQHALDLTGRSPPWRADQYVAAKIVEGLLAGAVVGAIVIVAAQTLTGGIVTALFVSAFYAVGTVNTVLDEAARRSRQVRARMSFATDLMALVIQAGGTPAESLEAVVKENAGHPIGEEFGMIVSQTRMGRLRADALRGFRDRYPDPDISDFVFALVKGEELGTPLALILNMQATQMRLKHSQWCEKQAAEAGVKMTFPSLLVMIACILVILGPILLPVVFGML